MAYITNPDPDIAQPTDPTYPSWCPTCLSGTQPRDPEFEKAIDADTAVG